MYVGGKGTGKRLWVSNRVWAFDFWVLRIKVSQPVSVIVIFPTSVGHSYGVTHTDLFIHGDAPGLSFRFLVQQPDIRIINELHNIHRCCNAAKISRILINLTRIIQNHGTGLFCWCPHWNSHNYANSSNYANSRSWGVDFGNPRNNSISKFSPSSKDSIDADIAPRLLKMKHRL